jgi:hypothetical protein
MPWRPEYPRERPTLGIYVLRWMRDNLIVPDGPIAGSPLLLTPEMQRFVMRLYELDPHGGESAIVGGALRNSRLIRRAVISRSKGWGKSPMLAGLCWVEALADIVPDGWDASGRPVGRPWASLGFKPKVQVVAASEDQTVNTWDPVLEMGREGPVGGNYSVDILETFITVPRGRIEYVSSATRSREGFRPVFCVCDQTETWTPSIGGPKLASAIRRNLVKTGGCSVESPNAFIPGEGSVAEMSWQAWEQQEEGKLKSGGILFDHREAPPETDPADRDSLMAGLKFAYGDSTWVDLDRVIADFWDPSTDPSDARRFFLNQIVAASDSLLSQPEWASRRVPKPVMPGDIITLGFDGSRGKAKGKPDATALIGCRVEDAYVFEIGVWEAVEGPGMEDWTPPLPEIDAAVDMAFSTYGVAAFYADPAKDWRSFVAEWEKRHGGKLVKAPSGKQLRVKADHPFEWWMTGGRSFFIQAAIEAFAGAVVNGDMTHDGSFKLTQHVLNARRRVRRQKLVLGKEHDYSPHKIDACIAAILAYQGRLDAVAAGIGAKPKRHAPLRVR